MTRKNGISDLAAILQSSELTVAAYTPVKTKIYAPSEQTYADI